MASPHSHPAAPHSVCAQKGRKCDDLTFHPCVLAPHLSKKQQKKQLMTQQAGFCDPQAEDHCPRTLPGTICKHRGSTAEIQGFVSRHCTFKPRKFASHCTVSINITLFPTCTIKKFSADKKASMPRKAKCVSAHVRFLLYPGLIDQVFMQNNSFQQSLLLHI